MKYQKPKLAKLPIIFPPITANFSAPAVESVKCETKKGIVKKNV